MNTVLITIAEFQGINYCANSVSVIRRLEISPILFKVSIIKLIKLGYAEWWVDNTMVKITEKGLMYVYENELMK